MSDEKRILIANAEPQALADFRQTLGEVWKVTAVASGPAALAEIKRRPFDVVVADLDLPELDGAELLDRIRKLHPKTMRFIVAADADKERVMKHVLGAHQVLSKPLDLSALKGTLERALVLDGWMASKKMRELVARIRTFPAIPSLYLEVLAALRSPSATTEEVGAIIAKDMAMTTRLQQVINSAYFGLSRRITDPAEAVGLLGFESVKSMIITIKLLSQYDKVKPVYFSIDRLWQHSVVVARAAKQLTLLQTEDADLAETAFTAGLLHDVGKVVLASNFDEQYRGVQSLARKQQMPTWEIEKEIFGADHGEIGAYLLGLWGMPLNLLEATALHHDPSRNLTKGFTPLTAVHVSNALHYEVNPDPEGAVSPKIQESYLVEMGLLDRLGAWRADFLGQSQSKSEPKPEPKETVAAAADLLASPPPAPAATRRVERPAMRHNIFMGRGWRYAVLGAGALVLLLVWAGKQLFTGPVDEPVFARQGSAPKRDAPAPPEPLSLPQTLGQQNHSRPQPSEATETKEASTDHVSALPTAANASHEAASAVPVPPEPPSSLPNSTSLQVQEGSFPALKLQGIILSSERPAVILNGKLVRLNDRLAGVRVVEIQPTSVILEYKGEQKIFKVK